MSGRELAQTDAERGEGCQQSGEAVPVVRLTKWRLLILGLINMIESGATLFMVPFAPEMVAWMLGASPKDPEVLRLAPMLISCYSVVECVVSPIWGLVADRAGMRPPMLLGLLGAGVSFLLMGFVRSLPAAFALRMLHGLFCGNASITRAYIPATGDSANIGYAYQTLSTSVAVAFCVGPLVGGMLADPVRAWPVVLGGGLRELLEEYPFLLPNLFFSILAFVAFIAGCITLQETKVAVAGSGGAAPLVGSGTESRELQSQENRSCLPTRRLVLVLLAMALFQGFNAARIQIPADILQMPLEKGGLGLHALHIGLFNGLQGIATILTQCCIFPRVVGRLGPYYTFIAGIACAVALALPFPAYLLSGQVAGWLPATMVAVLYFFFGNVAMTHSFTTLFQLVNMNSDPGSMGRTNGIANMLYSLLKGVVPMLCGWLTSLQPTAGFYSTLAPALLSMTMAWHFSPPFADRFQGKGKGKGKGKGTGKGK